ncbi:MAG: hypothetical protein [Caudoviricetes sp.]|nr:MAG: hypothetical protein [Caudoviricetes sp.]
MNNKFFQLQGPFNRNEEIVDRIRSSNSNFRYIKRIGIQSEEGNKCKINGISFEIGRNKILEFDEVEVQSLMFSQNETEGTLVDCVLG